MSDFSVEYAYEIIDKYTPALKKIIEQNKNFIDSQKKTQNVLAKVRSDVEKTAKSLDKLGKNLSLKITAPIIAAGALALHEWNKQEEANTQVIAVLKSTGNRAGRTFDQLAKQASDLQKTRLFSDDDILANVSASLLRFKGISGDTFDRAQKMALDLATAMKTDLGSASTFLGKALSNPLLSLRQLRIAGVQFNAQQQATLKMLVQTKQMGKAQKMVLDALDVAVGGRAEAAAKAGLGPMILAKQQLFDSLEKLGGGIFKILVKVTPLINGLAQAINSLTPVQMKWVFAIAALAAVVGPLLIALGWMATGFAILISPVGLITVGVLALAAGVAWLYFHWNKVVTAMSNVKFLRDIWGGLVAINGAIEGFFFGIFNFFNMIGNIIDRVILGIRQMVDAMNAVSNSQIGKIAGAVGKVVVNPMQAGVNLAGQIGINVNAAPGTNVKSVSSSFNKGVKTGVSMKNRGT